MKTASPFLSNRPPPQVYRLLFAFSIALATVFTMGCGAGSTSTPALHGNTAVTLLLSSTANDQLPQFNILLTGITLTNKAGKTFNLLSTPQGAEFIHSNGDAEPFLTVSVPQDVYTAATATVAPETGFTCVSLLPGELQTSYFTLNATPSATVNLPSPITVTGTAMGLSLNLQVSQSATFSSCYLQGASYTLAPAFNLTPVTVSSPPTSVENGKANGINGLLSSVNNSDNGFSLMTANGVTLTFNAGSNTAYQGIPGFSSLVDGMFVNMDAALQTNGSLLATRVEVEDADTATPTVVNGTVLNVVASEPVLELSFRQQQGYLFGGLVAGSLPFNFGSAVFQTSGQFTNLQNLPFVATFNSANMFAGQNVSLSAHGTSFPPGPAYVPLSTVTLMPQSINGTISGISSNGSFTTYDVTLAAYDLIPLLAVQPGQTTVLTNPSNVVVYVDSNTQMLNTMTLAVGGVLRFNGLLFNDSGTLSMDCGQVNDGVAE
jgi:Domain of unknown function (DUF5666)